MGEMEFTTMTDILIALITQKIMATTHEEATNNAISLTKIDDSDGKLVLD